MKVSFSFALFCVLLTCATLFAQDPRGTIQGRVVDPTGIGIPGAGVRITNEETGVSVSATSNQTGDYRAPYLLPGMYRIEAEAGGFSRLVRTAIQVRTTETVTLDLELKIGEVTETVEVTSETPLLSVADVGLGQVIDERRIAELPLFAGNAMDLVHFAPGIVNGTDLRLRKAPFNNAPSQFGTNGVSNYNNDFTIDGVVNVYSDGTQPRVAFSPPQTAIAEFKVQTSSFDASSGFSLGSVVNVTTKSGTNALHGELHHWLRHSKLDSATIFQNRAGQGVPLYQDNRFGGSVGGPVFIPKFYDGRNRTFWFFAGEGNLFGDPNVGSRVSTVPTADMRSGNLAPLLALTKNNQVYDPYTTTPSGDGLYQRLPFAGNVIPTSRLDPVAQNLLQAYPMPNQKGTTDFRQNFFLAGKALETYWTTIGRVDHAFSESHRMFFRFHRDYWQEDKNRYFGPDAPEGVILNRVNRGAALDDVIVLNPSTVLNFRYGLTQQEFPEQRVSQGTDLAALGFSSNLVGLIAPSIATFPRLAVAPWNDMSSWESGDGTTASLIHNFNSTLTWNHASHTVRVGFDWRNLRENRNRYPLSTSPRLQFNSDYTRGPSSGSPVPQVGGDIASFLLGIPNSNQDYGMAVSASYAERNSLFGFYVQDDYKVSRKLTLNLGLRYEVENGTTERYDRAVRNFDETAINPLNDQVRANYAAGSKFPEIAAADLQLLGGLTFVNASSNPRNYWNPAKTNFMPRIGIAYQLDEKTVFRGGYGIFYAPLGTLYTNTESAGYSLTTPVQASLDNGLTYIATLSNPFPNGLRQPLGAAGGLMTNIGQAVTAFPNSRKNAYAQRWSAGFQRLLPSQFLVEATYVGNRSSRLNVVRNMNYTPGEYLSTSPVRDQATINYLAATIPSPFYGTHSIFEKTISRGNFLKPFPEFGDVNIHEPVGYNWYHSLQTRLEKRFTASYTLQVSYTWSKNMEATQFLNPQDPTPYEVISSMDRTHRVSASGIWEIPIGKGRTWGTNFHPLVNGVLGGWQLNSSWQHQSGQPLDFGNYIFNGDLHNVVLPSDQRSVDQWFNVNAGFEKDSAKQLASNLRRFPLRFNGIRGPVQDRLDFGMIKNFPIKERFTLQFRAEAFNALNFANKGNPNTTVTSGAFGTITSQNPPRSWQGALKLTF